MNVILQEKNLNEVDATMLVRILATLLSQNEQYITDYHISAKDQQLL